MCIADISSSITYREIQQPGMLLAAKLGQVSHVGCTNPWHNHHSRRKLILCIPPPITSVKLTVDSTTLGVCEENWFKIAVYLKWKMC
jgi:hypothetical protein